MEDPRRRPFFVRRKKRQFGARGGGRPLFEEGQGGTTPSLSSGNTGAGVTTARFHPWALESGSIVVGAAAPFPECQMAAFFPGCWMSRENADFEGPEHLFCSFGVMGRNLLPVYVLSGSPPKPRSRFASPSVEEEIKATRAAQPRLRSRRRFKALPVHFVGNGECGDLFPFSSASGM